MLVLSRKANEKIRLGDRIVVTVVRVSGDRVRLGIEAPHELRVLREELTRGASPATGRPAAPVSQGLARTALGATAAGRAGSVRCGSAGDMPGAGPVGAGTDR